jgi:hypothetical protein
LAEPTVVIIYIIKPNAGVGIPRRGHIYSCEPWEGGGGTNIDIDQPLNGVPEQEAQLNKLKVAFMVLKFFKTEGFNSSLLTALKLQASTWSLLFRSTVPVKAVSPLMKPGALSALPWYVQTLSAFASMGINTIATITAITALMARRHNVEESLRGLKEDWLRGVDSNHDSQIQSLESYQLDDPGVAARSLAEGNSG